MQVTLFALLSCTLYFFKQCNGEDNLASPEEFIMSTNYFYYFAYGSNMLKKRMLINAPSAQFISIAKLEDYRLDFNVTVSLWNGAVATIARDLGNEVWGVVWAIHRRDMPGLDRQELTGRLYYEIKVPVETPAPQKVIVARTYKQFVDPPKLPLIKKMPSDRLPSRTYLKVILHGASEANLPDDYISKLKSIPSNQMLASYFMRYQLGYPFMN